MHLEGTQELGGTQDKDIFFWCLLGARSSEGLETSCGRAVIVIFVVFWPISVRMGAFSVYAGFLGVRLTEDHEISHTQPPRRHTGLYILYIYIYVTCE